MPGAFDAPEKVLRKTECRGHVRRRERRHGNKVAGAERRHGPDAVVGSDVREDHHVVFLQTAFRDEIFGKTGRHLQHLVRAERAPGVGSRDKGVEIGLLPLKLHEMADPGGPAGQGIDADFTGDSALGHILLGVEHDGFFFDGLEFHNPSFGNADTALGILIVRTSIL